MKASLKFREDGLPLLGAKLPFTLAGAPLVSGIAAGNSRDLCLSLGTLFEAGPCCKVAYQPNSSAGSVSLVLKMGSGLWGSPVGAALSMTAGFRLSGEGGPFFSLSVRPRVGDFCLRKHARPSLGKPPDLAAGHGSNREQGFGEYGATPSLQLEKSSLSIPVSNRDTLVHLQEAESFSIGTPGSASRETGPNLYFRAEVVDRGSKAGETKITIDGVKGEQIEGMSGLSKRGFVADVSNGILQEDRRDSGVREAGGPKVMAASTPVGFDACFRGWSLNAHSSLPVGKQAKLNIRWGLKVPSGFCSSWGNKLSGFSVTSLPFLLMDKISLESVNPTVRTPSSGNFRLNEVSGPLAYGLLPTVSFEDGHDPVHVTALCRYMKRQVELLYAENKVLRKAMEEMGAEIENRRGIYAWNTAGSPDGFPIQRDSNSPSHILETPQNCRKNEINRKDSLGKKDRRDLSRKESPFDRNGVSSEKSSSLGGLQSEVSEELKKAIKNATSSPFGEKTE